MSGVFFLLVLVIWIYIAKKMSGLLVSNIKLGTKRKVANTVIFIFIFITPVADEIAGRFQFAELCRDERNIYFDEDKLSGETVLWTGTYTSEIKNKFIPIMERVTTWSDINSAEKLIEYKVFIAKGGWLSRFISFNSVSNPYTFDGFCGVKDELMQLKNNLNIEMKYK